MRMSQIMTSAALMGLLAVALPAARPMAGELVSGVTGAASTAASGISRDGAGAAASVKAEAGKVSAKLDANAGLDSTPGVSLDADVRLEKNRSGGTLTAAARAELIADIRARARVLGPKRLLGLCVAVGAKGCKGASRARQIARIEARLRALPPHLLARVCVSVGGSCGGALVASDAGAGGTSAGIAAAAARDSVSLASSAGAEERQMRLTCRKVLRNQHRYEAGLVGLCRRMIE